MDKRNFLEPPRARRSRRAASCAATLSLRRALLPGLVLLALAQPSLATPLDDVGFGALQAQLGSRMPTGAGVSVAQVEGDGDPDPAVVTYLPNLANAEFTGKVITDGSQQQTGGFSSHALGVGRRFYGNLSSGAPGITTITGYLAENWLGEGFVRASLQLFAAPQPLVTDSRIANHSWVGSAGNFDADMLRRVDWLVERDEYVQVAGFTGGANAPLLGSAYNVIAVNQTRSPTDAGSAAVDSVYTAGRVRPDLVAPENSPSNAVPMVASATALLVEVAHADPTLSRDPYANSRLSRAGDRIYNAERSETIKAILMAGADRGTANGANGDIADYRLAPEDRTANGLDRRYGAGQLNVYNSYQILAAGEQNHDQDDGGGSGNVTNQGFDYEPAFGGSAGTNAVAWYYLPPADEGAILTAALVWNLKVDGGSANNFSGTATLYDLSLELYDVSAGSPQRVARSQSEVDNTEHVWEELTAGRRYALKVVPGTSQPAFNWDYALAWRQLVPPPPDADEDGVPDASDNCPATPNPGQENFDGDGQGDACDADDDGDGVPDADDRFPFDAAEWADADADGIGDNADPDDDNDTLPDDWEELYGFDRANPADAATDADGDGLSQLEEFLAQTHPRDADTDDDLVSDGADNCRLAGNPDQQDTDADGQGDACDTDDDDDAVPDATDNCPLTPNPGQENFDGDGQGDACDPDDDGDGVPDAEDRFPFDGAEWADADADGTGDNADPDDDNDTLPDDWEELYGFDRTNPADAATDADGDGLSQLEEFLAQTHPRDADTDDDLVSDGADNCRLAGNPDQRDTDADGQGDACDTDDDADAVPDFADNCPVTPNPAQADQDADGIGDVCDPFPEGLQLASRLPILLAPRTADGLRIGYAASGPELPEAGRAALGDPLSVAEVTEIGFTGGLAAIDAALVDDASGDGADGIALLAFDEFAEQPKVEVRDAGDGGLVRGLAFNVGYLPRALGVLPDQTGNASPEIAVLAERITDGRGRVLIRDLQTRSKLEYLWLPRAYRPLELEILPDISGNGSAEVLVLAQRRSDQKGVVLVRDTGGAGKISNIRLPAGHEPRALAGFAGPGGAAVAVLTLRTADQRGRLLVYDAFSGARLWVSTLGAGRAPVALRARQRPDGAWYLAVLLHRLTNLRPLVSFYDPATGLATENHWFAASASALDVEVIPDTPLDAGGGPELLVLVRNDPGAAGATVLIEDLLSRELLQTLELP